MARIPVVESAPPEAEALYGDFIRERGAVPNMFRTLAHAPEVLKTAFAHFRAVMAEGAVSTRVKEMVGVRVSHLNGCTY